MVSESKEKGPRARRREASRERILDAAASVVQEEGIDALSVRRVADLADYTPGALYRYFPSRDAILAAVTELTFERLRLRSEAASEGREGLEALCALVDAYRDFALEDPNGFTLVTLMISDPRLLVADAAISSALTEQVMGALLPLQGAMMRALQAGDLSMPPDEILLNGIALVAGVQGALQLAKLERRAPELVRADAICGQLARTLLAGWGAPRDRIVLRPPVSRADTDH